MVDTLIGISIPDFSFTSQTLSGINPGYTKSRLALTDVMCSTGNEPVCRGSFTQSTKH